MGREDGDKHQSRAGINPLADSHYSSLSLSLSLSSLKKSGVKAAKATDIYSPRAKRVVALHG